MSLRVSPRRTAAVLFTLLLVAAGCSDSNTGPQRVVHSAGASIHVSAPVVQPGADPAPADGAQVVVHAHFRPARVGQNVTIQRRAGSSDWTDVGTVTRGKEGLIRYVGDAQNDASEPYQYRVVGHNKAGEQVTTGASRAQRWQLKFSDEFDGAQLDTNVWNYRQEGVYSPASDRACSASSRRAVSIKGGALLLSAKEDDERTAHQGACGDDDGNRRDDTRWYLNGHVGTGGEGRFHFRYGYAAARVRFDARSGAHGSFWVQSGVTKKARAGANENGAEIDVVEYFGDAFAKWHMPRSIYSFIYYPTPEGEPVKVPGDDTPRQAITERDARLAEGDGWSTGYHVFSVLWTPKEYTFYVDGVQTQSVKRGVSGVPEFLILSTLTSGWEAKKLPEGAQLQTRVDWVRVWQQPDWSCTGAPAC